MGSVSGGRNTGGNVRPSNGIDPPPSSMLATHLAPVNGDGTPQINRVTFNLLLDVSLGQDEAGNPNLGTDVSINHKLICIVIKAGLNEAENSNTEDPFHSRDAGRGPSQVDLCLDVICLAIQRSPGVLYVVSGSEELASDDDNIPFYLWLIPKLLPLLGKNDSDAETTLKARQTIQACLEAETNYSHEDFGPGAVVNYVNDCINVLEDQLERSAVSAETNCMVSLKNDHDGFVKGLSKLRLTDARLSSTFQVGSRTQTLQVICQLLAVRSLWASQQTRLPRISQSRCVQQTLSQFQRLAAVISLNEQSRHGSNCNMCSAVTCLAQSMFSARSLVKGSVASAFQQKYSLLWGVLIANFVDVDALGNHSCYLQALRILLSLAISVSGEITEFSELLNDMAGQQLQELDAFTRASFADDVELRRAVVILVLGNGSPAPHGRNSIGEKHDDYWPDGGRAPKRARLSTEGDSSIRLTRDQRICQEVTRLLMGDAMNDLAGLSKISVSRFRDFTEAQKCEALTVLGRASCTASDNSVAAVTLADASEVQCQVCHADSPSDEYPSRSELDADDELLKTVIALYPAFKSSPRVRVVGLLTLRQLLLHTESSEYLKLDQSVPGEICLNSLRASSRDVRLTATRLLGVFVRRRLTVDSKIVHMNRVIALDFLQTLWSKNEIPTKETAVLGLTSVAEVVDDEELNIILLRLVEYLGHGNPYISGIVYSELQRLAGYLQLTVATLLRPFWRTIGVVVIKHFQTRPAIPQQLCDLLGMQIDGLLVLIEEFVLPHLVFAKKQDVIHRIAAAHGPSASPFLICTHGKHLPNILSFLMMQPAADPEESILALLLSVSDEFREHDLAGWVSHEPIFIACELLKAIVDAGEGHGSRIHQALHLLAQLMSRRPGQSSSSRRSDSVGQFLENNALAIISHFSVMLNETQMKEHNVEKRRCLAAIGEVARLGKSRIAAALPPICACLRSAMELKDLCNSAFAAWVLMMSSLKDEDIEPLVDQTLALIIRTWDMLDSPSQHRAYGLVADLLQKHTSLVREIFETLPSLSSIPVMSKFGHEIDSLKRQMDDRHQLMAFVKRLQSENHAVIEQSLRELLPLLEEKRETLHRSILREQPDKFVADLCRVLLDTAARYGANNEIALLCGQSLGRIGCLDPNKIETIQRKKAILNLSNFGKADETVDFIFFFLDNVLVRSFVSASSARLQGFLAWAMQELLKLCELDSSITLRSKVSSSKASHAHWQKLSESVRNTLTPFLSSRYFAKEARSPEHCQYPLFQAGTTSHKTWLRTIVLDMLSKGPGENVKLIFGICSRIIHGQDVAIPTFLLPFTALNVILSGVAQEKEQLVQEMLLILSQPLIGDHQAQEDMKLCSESVFEVLDYLSKWVQAKKKVYAAAKAKQDAKSNDTAIEIAYARIKTVEHVLETIPPDTISQRAIECKSYARALFHWEQYIRRRRGKDGEESDAELERLQEIYAQIDEPDGIEGISSQLHVLSIEQQILEHRKAGRWTAAQNWYELQLNERPADPEVQVRLMQCLKESGQYDVLLHHFDGMDIRTSSDQVIPFAVEAAWVAGRWNKLTEYLNRSNHQGPNFDVGIAEILQAMRAGAGEKRKRLLDEAYHTTAATLRSNSIASLQACHDTTLKLHVLADLDAISTATADSRPGVLDSLQSRLDMLGSYVTEKQYLLGVRRAAMELTDTFNQQDVAAGWLASARLARKASSMNQAFNAILRATAMGEKSATIEQAKLTWKEGHHRKAIQTLEGAIESGAFVAHNTPTDKSSVNATVEEKQLQNQITAKAYVLLGKWLDTAGQTQSEVIIRTFRKATEDARKWEKGWYYLGKHYNKILDSEKTMPAGKESQAFLNGEATKVVIDNYLRSLVCSTKYIFQTLPKILTLWMELVAGTTMSQDARRGSEKFHAHNAAQRKRVIEETNAQVKKYIDRLPAVALYTILPQVVARICHPDQAVYNILVLMVVKVVKAFPQQALWTLLAVLKSQSKDRASRGLTIYAKAVESQKKSGKDTSAADLRAMVTAGQKFSDEMLRVADFTIEHKQPRVSLARELRFNHKIAPSRLVVPIEACLTPSIPQSSDSTYMKTFRAFSKEPVTITAFLDEALVLASLQKPRRLTIRGSDGLTYDVLAKPKDDMRKDQRLMEFNTMINRFLKRDVEASKRRLYIRTYAVVPLNEECGLIEWVDNLKTFRDILLKLYKEKTVQPNYLEIRHLLDEACAPGQPPEKAISIFNDKILKSFPPIFHEWFVESFPDPATWFTARLRYTRSAAVMSIVGHVLGLGDRHGENILFEEGNGGTLHVDFNCLFDKGLTFEKPEMVPFRLTHNMVDAFGAYGYNGPFRKCSEITLTLLRSNEDALMTILETFLHDPTTDFLTAGKRKKASVPGVPDTPIGVLDGVRSKVRGMLQGESVPLSVGGYVEEMIKRAVDPKNLCRMYIGWCAFF